MLHSNIRWCSQNTTIILLRRHQHITIITPIIRPTVLNQPIILPIERTITHRQHSMIQLILFIAAFRFIVDAIRVKTQCTMAGIDRHTNRTVLDNRQFHCIRIVLCHIHETGDFRHFRHPIRMAIAVLRRKNDNWRSMTE